jgi:hypothetical protein
LDRKYVTPTEGKFIQKKAHEEKKNFLFNPTKKGKKNNEK